MKRTQLFWHLLRFHFQVMPWFMFPLLLFLLLIVSVGVGLSHFVGNGVSYNSYRNFDQIFPFFYIFMLAAQVSWGLQLTKAAGQNQAWGNGNYAFLFTRAIHRPTLYWAKLVFFFAACLSVVFPTLVQAILQPDVRIQLHQKPAAQEEKIALYRASYPNLTLTDPETSFTTPIVTLPGAIWNQLFIKFSKVMLLSLATLWISVQARRWPKIWIVALAVLLLGSFGPLILMLTTKIEIPFWRTLTDDEALLLWSGHHQGAILLSLVAVSALVFWDSRQRFLNIPKFKTSLT